MKATIHHSAYSVQVERSKHGNSHVWSGTAMPATTTMLVSECTTIEEVSTLDQECWCMQPLSFDSLGKGGRRAQCLDLHSRVALSWCAAAAQEKVFTYLRKGDIMGAFQLERGEVSPGCSRDSLLTEGWRVALIAVRVHGVTLRKQGSEAHFSSWI